MAESGFTAENQRRISRFIEDNFGIRMPESKRQLLLNRLSRRLRELGFKSYDEYVDFVLNTPEGEREIVQLINAVSTNKTDFFREPRSLDYISATILPKIINESGGRPPLAVWSCACSSGEEPYSLAMLLADFGPERFSKIDFLATDISTAALEKALRAVYGENQLHTIPPLARKRYTLTSRDRQRPTFRIAPEIRGLVKFRRLNLMDANYALDRKFDIILCRNVLIYFGNTDKHEVVRRLLEYLKPGGYLVIGNSESLIGLAANLHSVIPGVYRLG